MSLESLADAQEKKELDLLKSRVKSKMPAEDSRSQTQQIIDFVKAQSELFHGPNNVTFAKEISSGEVRRVDSRAFRDWLTHKFYTSSGRAIRETALREAKMTIAGLAMQRFKEVAIRVAGSKGDYWLDLAKPGSSLAIHLQPGSYKLCRSPFMFTRSDTVQELPEPAHNGDIRPLWDIANIPENSRLLVIAWIVECLRPDTPYPVLELLGEYGSAKSTTASVLRRLIDPNDANLRGVPKSDKDFVVSAGVNHLICLENVSHLSAAIQDAMCIAATGGGFAARRLYTDAEEAVINIKRPIITNGIAAAITRQDLVSRTITVVVPRITDAQESDKLQEEFKRNLPTIFAGLMHIAAMSLKYLPNMQLPPDRRPRLLEFSLLGMAVAKAMGLPPSDFMKQFESAKQDGLERTLEANPVAMAIREWVAKRHYSEKKTAGQWLCILSKYKPLGSGDWPSSAKGLGDAMRRAAPSLRQLGITCESGGKTGGRILWHIGQEQRYGPSHASYEVTEGIERQPDTGLYDVQDFI